MKWLTGFGRKRRKIPADGTGLTRDAPHEPNPISEDESTVVVPPESISSSRGEFLNEPTPTSSPRLSWPARNKVREGVPSGAASRGGSRHDAPTQRVDVVEAAKLLGKHANSAQTETQIVGKGE